MFASTQVLMLQQRLARMERQLLQQSLLELQAAASPSFRPAIGIGRMEPMGL